MANISSPISVFERMTIVMARDLKLPEFGSEVAVVTSTSCLEVEIAIKWLVLCSELESSAALVRWISSAPQPPLMIVVFQAS